MNANLEWGRVLATPPPSPVRDTLARRLFGLDPLLTLAAGLLAVVAVAASIQSSGWVDSMPALPLVAALGLLAGFVSARMGGTARRRAWVAAGAMLGAGSVVVVATTISAIETGGNPWERWNAFRDRMDIWWDVVLHGGISDDQIPFILLVVAVTWLASFAMAWSLFALRNAWLALIPLTLVIVFNSAYRELSFDWGVVVFLFAALVLIARAASERQRERWLADDTEYPEFLGLQSFWRSMWVAALLLLAAWMLPSNSGDQAFGGVWQNVGDTIDERVFDSGRFFAAVQGTRGDPFRDFGEVLPLGGSIDLRNRQQLRVELSESVPFLRLVAYEQYDGAGWLAGDRRRVSAPSAGVPAPSELAAVDAAERPPGLVIAEIEVRRPHRWLAVPGDPIGADRGFDAGVPLPQSFALPLREGAAQPEGVPPELLAVLPELQRSYVPPGPGSAASFNEMRDRLPPGYLPRTLEHDPPQLIVERDTGIAGALALEPQAELERGDRYRIAGQVANASPEALRSAGVSYPAEIIDRFLQLPAGFSSAVTQLAAEVTAGAATPYDQAVAIEQYLRSFPYDETIPRPPAGVDRVEQFLFVTQRGYFDYHASAMAVMLRATGVPARLATGYYVDETGEDGRYVLRERHTYSWPEVFFPGAGWVQFNPTPNLPTVGRLGEGGFAEPEIDPAGRGNEFGLGALDISALDELNLGDVAAASPAETLAVDDTGGGRSLLWLWLAIGAAGLALFVGGARFAWERSVAGLPGPAKLWEKTIRLSALAGGGPRAQQTPREFARELAARLDGDPGVAKLAGAYEGARFGRREPAEDELDALREDYRRVRGKLILKALRWRSQARDRSDGE